MEVGNAALAAPSAPASEPPSVEMVFRDFQGRRAGVLKALTTDCEEFYRQCDPEKDNLCLYGYPDERWEVTLPVEDSPAELPEPIVGINFSRDAAPKKDWIALVALHSDLWLLSVAFCFGARFGFDKADRKHLFNRINSLPTICEVVTGSAKKQATKKPSASSHNSNKSKPGSKAQCQSELGKYSKPAKEDKGLDEKDEDQGQCAKCRNTYITTASMFWICCDTCDKWYHGKCVKVSPAMAEHMPNYQCPACSIIE